MRKRERRDIRRAIRGGIVPESGSISPAGLDSRTIGLIEWAIDGYPETGILPVGAADILASHRQADLFSTRELVERFGPSAAEPFRQAYGFPESLIEQPEAIVTPVPTPDFSDGIAQMLLAEPPPAIGHDEQGWAIVDEGLAKKHWSAAAADWHSREQFRRGIHRRVRNILWLEVRKQDRANREYIARQKLEQGQLDPEKFLELAFRRRDVGKAMEPVQRMMPDLSEYFRILSDAANPKTGEVDWTAVGKRYGIPARRIQAYRTMMERRWQSERARIQLAVGGYMTDQRRVFIDQDGNFAVRPEQGSFP